MRIVTLFTDRASELCVQPLLACPGVDLVVQRDINGVLASVRSGCVHAALIEDNEVRLGHWLAVLKSHGLARFPSIIVGAGRPGDITRALRCGAADYACVNDGAESILARLRARVEASEQPEDHASVLQVGAYVLDRARQRITHNGREIVLTAREFALAWLLFEYQGRVVTLDTVAARVWGRAADISRRSIQQYIYRLRCKLGETPHAGGPVMCVQAVYGIGYRLYVGEPQRESAGAWMTRSS